MWRARRKVRVVLKESHPVAANIPDILTAEQLREYFPGHNCRCGAYDQSECGCNDSLGVNWTPKEIYEQRNQICDLEKQICDLEARIADLESLLLYTSQENDTLHKQNNFLQDENDCYAKMLSKQAEFGEQQRICDQYYAMNA